MNREKIVWFTRHRLLIGLLSLSPFIWFLAFMAFDLIVNGAISCQRKNELLNYFAQITLIPNGTLVEEYSGCEGSKAYVRTTFTVQLTRDRIFDYYDQELKRLGWSYLNQEAITYDAMKRKYCMGNFTATVAYYGTGYEWNHQLYLDAGMLSDCEMMKGGGIAYVPFSHLWFSLGCSVSWLIYAVIIYSVIWRKDAITYVYILGGGFKGKARPENAQLNYYRRTTSFIIVTSAIGIVLSLYKIIKYLESFLFLK
jgi:hypothetical protein